jgi:predicted ABC-type ATPase
LANKLKRLRIFAGPNGSGKTTLVNYFPTKIPLGIVVNADQIERELKEKNQLNFKQFSIKVTLKSLLKHFETGICKTKHISITESQILISQNTVRFNKLEINSYIAADIAEYVRRKLLESGQSFSFETVFSHPSKLSFMQLAQTKGYRIYLYFIATESSLINISRVENRVAKLGHEVDSKLISSRYKRTLDNLYDAVKLTNRAYVFDNSGEYSELICEVTDGKKVTMRDIDKQPPEWFKHYFYKKAINNIKRI